MPPYLTQGPSAYEMGSLIWLKHGAADPRRAHFPRLISLLSHSSVKVGSSRPQLHAICTQARRRAVTVLTTTCHLPPRLATAPSVRGPGMSLPIAPPPLVLPPQWDWLGAGGRATPLIPQGPAVATSGVTMVIHITADPPPSKLEPCHRVLTPAGTASPSTSPISRLHSSPKALTLRFSTPHKV